MDISDYKRLPDYLDPLAVDEYCLRALAESSTESVWITIEKLKELSDRQWHTYRLPPKALQIKLQSWLVKHWSSDSPEYLEAVMIISYCFGLEKRIFVRALKSYRGKFRTVFQKDLENSSEDFIDPWWGLKGNQRKVQGDQGTVDKIISPAATRDNPNLSKDAVVDDLIGKWYGSLIMRDWEDSLYPDPIEYRKSLMRQLIEMGEVAVKPLITKLSNADSAVRSEALLMLGRIKSETSKDALVSVIAKDPQKHIRYQALHVLKQIGCVSSSWIKNEEDQLALTSKQKLNVVLDEWYLIGEIDRNLHERAKVLAQKRKVAVDKIISSWGAYYATESPRLDLIPGTIRITPEEAEYLEDLYSE
jgi:hypothetical protein